MFARVAEITLLLALCIASARASVLAEHIEVGVHHPGQRFVSSVRLDNDSANVLTVLRQTTGSERMRATQVPLVIPAHGSAKLPIEIEVDRMLGRQTYYADFDLDGEQKSLRVVASLFVDSAIEGEPMSVDFGLVPAGAEQERKIDFTSRDLPDIRAQTASDKANFVDAVVADGGKAVVLRTRKDSSWGMHDGWVQISTSSAAQPTAWVKYHFEARGRVVPETYQLSAGLLQAGRVRAQTLFIRDTEGEALHLGKISQRGAPVIVRETDCPSKPVSCRALEVEVDESKLKSARFSSELSIELPQYEQTITISYFGRIVPTDTKVVDLNAQIESQEHNKAELRDLNAVLKSITHPDSSRITMETPGGHGPLLKWNVQNEQQIYGYIIYRADSEDGPMRRIDDKIIETLSREDGVSVEYMWRDTTAQPGHTYWYEIGTVDQRGVRKSLTGRVKKMYMREGNAT